MRAFPSSSSSPRSELEASVTWSSCHRLALLTTRATRSQRRLSIGSARLGNLRGAGSPPPVDLVACLLSAVLTARLGHALQHLLSRSGTAASYKEPAGLPSLLALSPTSPSPRPLSLARPALHAPQLNMVASSSTGPVVVVIGATGSQVRPAPSPSPPPPPRAHSFLLSAGRLRHLAPHPVRQELPARRRHARRVQAGEQGPRRQGRQGRLRRHRLALRPRPHLRGRQHRLRASLLTLAYPLSPYTDAGPSARRPSPTSGRT